MVSYFFGHILYIHYTLIVVVGILLYTIYYIYPMPHVLTLVRVPAVESDPELSGDPPEKGTACMELHCGVFTTCETQVKHVNTSIYIIDIM